MGGTITSVRAEKLTKLFGPVGALRALDVEVKAGEVLAVMGPNGAGKSTLLGLLSLTTRPTRGRVLIDDRPARPSDPELRRRIGLLSHQPLVYPDLTGHENLVLFAKLHQLDDPDRSATAAAERFAPEGFFADQPARVLSRGQLQRLALARALLAEPDLLLLDEPAAGLDANAVQRIEQALATHRDQGRVAVLVTHEPELAAAVATRALLLSRGRIAADEPAPEDASGWRDLYISALGGGGR
ncbi:MAG: ATP-binding cassette domain-containing protein [Deltaproteobacteria bacterium]|nr:ATP-binding cassette domain-containing protein [Deltaproteobacteria bacterium]